MTEHVLMGGTGKTPKATHVVKKEFAFCPYFSTARPKNEGVKRGHHGTERGRKDMLVQCTVQCAVQLFLPTRPTSPRVAAKVRGERDEGKAEHLRGSVRQSSVGRSALCIWQMTSFAIMRSGAPSDPPTQHSSRSLARSLPLSPAVSPAPPSYRRFVDKRRLQTRFSLSLSLSLLALPFIRREKSQGVGDATSVVAV